MEREMQCPASTPADGVTEVTASPTTLVVHPETEGAAALPDSANERAALEQVALNWVGMRGIAMPVMFAAGAPHASPASIGAWVDLADRNARGIHMSRIYTVLHAQLANQLVEEQTLRRILDAMLESQARLSRRAQIEISAGLMLLRPALVSSLAGWQHYPLTLRARKSGAGFAFEAELKVGYSSTCPSSAALAQRAQADAFSVRFQRSAVASSEAAAWLASPEGTVATAHAQRSEARIRVLWREGRAWPDLVGLIDRCEAALGTPLQTAVKRIDEQAFAVRNAENLMFCEDAARRLHAAFAGDSQLDDFDIRVAHLESLHAHDAVARVSRSGDYRSLAVCD